MNELKTTCYIFGAAPIDCYGIPRIVRNDGDTVICADGGYDRAIHFGISPDWVVGDFDSKLNEQVDIDVIRVKPEKDDTDMQLALSHGISLGYRRFVIFGALGGRFDHSIANLQLLAELTEAGMQAVLIDEQNEVSMIKDGSLKVTSGDYKYVSIFSYSEVCEGVTLLGMKYPLSDYTLTNKSGGLGTSNEILGESAIITVRKGTLIVMRTRDIK